MVRQLKAYFLEVYHLPMMEQKEILKQKLDSWMKEGNETQLDDILVIGMCV